MNLKKCCHCRGRKNHRYSHVTASPLVLSCHYQQGKSWSFRSTNNTELFVGLSANGFLRPLQQKKKKKKNKKNSDDHCGPLCDLKCKVRSKRRWQKWVFRLNLSLYRSPVWFLKWQKAAEISKNIALTLKYKATFRSEQLIFCHSCAKQCWCAIWRNKNPVSLEYASTVLGPQVLFPPLDVTNIQSNLMHSHY